MSGVETVEVEPDDAGIRLDRWFKRHYPELSHGRLEKLLRTGQVRVDGGRAKSNQRLEEGQAVRVPPLPDASKTKRQAPFIDRRAVAELRNRIIHRDDHLIVLDKPAGLAVQGGSGISSHVDALLDGLRFGSKERPKLVHRLDKDTSGVLLIGRTAKAAASLTAAFRGHETRKLYWALVEGVARPREGTIKLPLEKLPGPQGDRVNVVDRGRNAETHYRTVDVAAPEASWLALEPVTGRTHQLRVHCAAIGHPIVGDGKYGSRDAALNNEAIGRRLHLHARAVRIPHPAGGLFEVGADLPPHMSETWKFFGFGPADDDHPFETFDELMGV